VSPRRWPRWPAVLAAATLLLAAPACTSAQAPEHASVQVTPSTSQADQAVHIIATGLDAGQRATIVVASVDANNARWQSTDVYQASQAGVVDVNRTAPVSGGYRGADGMGPVWSMTPAAANGDPDYFWPQRPATFTVTVTANGARLAQTSFDRALSVAPFTEEAETLQADGFISEFYQPTGGSGRRPAVLYFGGSEGGSASPLLGIMLASHGYDALGLGYFGLPGLPSTLADIPLEYFAKALRWLAAQPGVNPARIAVLGVSRGSEAAQLLGVHYPSLVHAVIASVPSNAAICSFPNCNGPAWTFDGKPVPYASQIRHPMPSNSAAAISDQKINGPVFLDCGEADRTWPSCPYAEAILNRLNSGHDRFKHVLYAYPGAGHYVGSFAPYQPVSVPARYLYAPSFAAIQQAEPALWQHLLAFLSAFAATGN
jgi:dienelactone hydrolase